jgi:hypothetical protein
MFERNSRYYNIETKLFSCNGGKIIYLRRRFVPKINRDISFRIMICCAGDRLDLIAERVLGDSEGFWRICDVNYELNPRMYCQLGKLITLPVRK